MFHFKKSQQFGLVITSYYFQHWIGHGCSCPVADVADPRPRQNLPMVGAAGVLVLPRRPGRDFHLSKISIM